MRMQDIETEGNSNHGIFRRIFGIIFPKSIFSYTIASALLILITFLLPLFVLPGVNFGAMVSKTLLFQAGIVLAALLIAGSYLREQSFAFPRSSIFYASWIAMMLFILAGAFSPVPRVSFFGIGGELGTVAMVTLSFVSLLVSALVFNSEKRFRALFLAFTSAAALLVIYQFIFGSSSRFFSGIVSPAGTFNDFAIFLGALEIVSLSVLYFYREKKFLRVLGYAGVLVPLPFLIAVDFRLLWYGLTLTLGIWMLVVTSDIAHVLCMFNERRSRLSAYLIALTRIPRTSVVLFALALTLSFGGGSVLFGNTSLVSSMRKLTHIAPVAEVRLSTSGTFMIAHHILSESPFFGAGPNRFADTFLRFKDAALNTTPVWDKVYDQGFGFFPTLLVTAGLLFAAALLYLVFAFVTASRYLRRVLSSDRSISFPVVTLYTLAAFFLLFLVFSTPGASVLGLAFILMGAFVGSLGAAGLIGGLQMGILGRDQRRIVDGIAIVKFLGLVFLAFILTREALAFIHYRAGQLAAVDGDLVTARAELYTAQGIFPTDTYVRDISVLALLDLDKTKRVASASKDEVTKHAFDLIHIAKLSSEEAVRLNPAKAKNYVQQGATFEALASLGVTSAYTPAREAYAAALLRDPTSPDVMYYAGRTALAAGDRKSAVEWFTKVLAIRPNHKSTLAALIPILESNGNTEGVRSVLIRAVEFDANNADSRFALGLFYYKEHAFSEAAKQFAAALRSDAQYADARFYLAGSAYELGEKDFALQQLRIVQQSNPRHELLNQFISAIEQGNDPFAEDIYGTQNN